MADYNFGFQHCRLGNAMNCLIDAARWCFPDWRLRPGALSSCLMCGLVFWLSGSSNAQPTSATTEARRVRRRGSVEPLDLFRPENLLAWCIVPFDARQRGPAERAAMLAELGIRRCAYDWRAEHVPTFEEEILQYQRHGIEMTAFWGQHDEAFRLFEKYGLRPQIWQIIGDPGGDEDTKVARAVAALEPLARRTEQLRLPLGLYNHMGWDGEPENMVAVCQRLHELGYTHVGVV